MAESERKAQKSFELRDSRDILEKLRWELDNLFYRERHDRGSGGFKHRIAARRRAVPILRPD